MERTEEERGRLGLSAQAVRTRLGIFLILMGLVILLDLYLKTGWLTLAVVALVGFGSLAGSLLFHRWGWMIAGSLGSGLGAGALVGLSPLFQLAWRARVGDLLAAFGAAWLLTALLSWVVFHRSAWWALAPGGVILALGLVFLRGPLSLVGFALYVLVGLGLALLAWGLFERLFGLIIPGCLLLGIGPGVYAGWGPNAEPNGLVQTGIMLVGFALGWGLITVFSRRVTQKFVWWPLIPGGVLAMVGWGLYIGGDPDNALGFIGNTGSIGLILFGVYLILLRRGIQK